MIILYSEPNKDVFRTFEQDDLQTFQPQPFCETKDYNFKFTQDLGKIQALELRSASKA